MKPSAAEVALFGAEAITSAALVALLHKIGPREHPNDTWKLVTCGVILSALPTMTLARIDPACWKRYELRALAGFFVSAAIVVPWQIWLQAVRHGELKAWLIQQEVNDDQEATLV